MIVNFLTYNKITGEVLSSGYGSTENIYLNESEETGVIPTESYMEWDCVYVDIDKLEVVNIGKKPSANYKLDTTNKLWCIDDVKLSNSIKLQRNYLLSETDWSQLPDVSKDTALAYSVYRQELRDITDQSEFPTNITWPAKPILG